MVACERTTGSATGDLLNRAVCEITHRIAGIKLIPTSLPADKRPGWGSLIVRTNGDYESVLILSADEEFFYEVSQRMKRKNDISIKDVMLYIPEFYNILCGFFISHLNSRLHSRSRFGIPQFIRGRYTGISLPIGYHICLQYKCLYGNLEITGYGLPIINNSR